MGGLRFEFFGWGGGVGGVQWSEVRPTAEACSLVKIKIHVHQYCVVSVVVALLSLLAALYVTFPGSTTEQRRPQRASLKTYRSGELAFTMRDDVEENWSRSGLRVCGQVKVVENNLEVCVSLFCHPHPPVPLWLT